MALSGTATLSPSAAGLPAAAAMRAELRGWMVLAVGSFGLAAALALVLAASRTPGVLHLLPAGWDAVFRRVLVTHVVFSFVVWCLTMLGGLSAAAAGQARGAWLSRGGLALAWAGAAALLLPTLAGQGTPSIGDYVPVLDHPLYALGLVLLCAGVSGAVLRLLAGGGAVAEPFRFAVAVAGVAAMAAFACFAIAALRLPAMETAARNQLLFWGGGHVLQFAYTALTLAAWHALAVSAFDAPPLRAARFRWLVATLLPGILAGPPLVAVLDLTGPDHLLVFTELMRWGLAAAPAAIGGAAVLLAWRRRGDCASPAAVALILSVALFGIGGLAGYFSPGGDTRTPGHYHASLSAVNVALMGLVWTRALPALGLAGASARLVRRQLLAFGAGQLAFAAGMFLAGTEGVPRKTAGLAQGLDQPLEAAAMVLAGVGGVVAVGGGLMFASLVLRRLAGPPR